MITSNRVVSDADEAAIQFSLPLLRQSERAAFKRCNWAWYQSYVNHLQPINERKEIADFGTLMHMALAEYYSKPGFERGTHPAETWEKLAGEHVATLKVQKADDDELIAKWVDFAQLGLVLAEAYVERYQGDPHWEVLDAERRFEVTVPDVRVPRIESKNGKRGYTPIVKLVGTFDLCVRDHNEPTKHAPGTVKMVDHKTAATFQTHHLTLDEQAGTYISVATFALRNQGLIGDKEVVKGMEYNYIKRAELDNRPRNSKGLACNKPIKKHYIEMLTSTPAEDHGDFVPYGEDEMASLEKMKLVDLKELTDKWYPSTPVLGDVSANQDGDNFMRHFVPRTPKERQRQIVRISEEARVMAMVRSGELPLLKTPQRDCYYCKFFDLCEIDESGGDTEYFINTTMKSADPYADHRDGADNSKRL